MMTIIILNIFYFLFVTLLFHPLFVILLSIILLFIICGRLSPRIIRHIEEIDLLWLKNFPCSDNIRLIWFDPYLESQNVIQERLKEIDSNIVFITDVSLCETIIKKIHRDECKSIFLILSGSLTEEFLPRITSDVHTIFIFCFDENKYLHLKNQPKVDMISNSPLILIQRIEECFSSLKRRYVIEHEQQSLRNLSKETATFIWFHSLRNVVRHFKKSDQAKDDMMKRFREYYQDNPKQLDRLINFSHEYESDHCLWWYTQPSFISDIINKTFRALDIDGLFDLRYCISDLCQILEEEPRLTEPMIVYRALLMDQDKFEQMKKTINTDDLLSMRGFLSTSLKPEIAERFGWNDANDPNKV
jgi:hypothetical protein